MTTDDQLLRRYMAHIITVNGESFIDATNYDFVLTDAEIKRLLEIEHSLDTSQLLSLDEFLAEFSDEINGSGASWTHKLGICGDRLIWVCRETGQPVCGSCQCVKSQTASNPDP